MQSQSNIVIRTRVTVAVVVFIIFNLLVSTAAHASEVDDIIPANDNFIRTAGELNAFVYKNLDVVRSKIGKNFEANFNSLECQSIFVRDSAAGTCLLLANSKTSSEAHALYAILIGEADENGGMMIRKVEFLKQSN